MGKVFHPVSYKGKSDDVAGGSWSEPYFQPGHGEDNAHPLEQTNCGLAAPNEDDGDYTDGMTAQHAVETLRNASAAAKHPTNPTPFFVAVGFHRPHLPWVVPSKYFSLYANVKIGLADYNERPIDYNVTGAQPYSWDPESGPVNQTLYITHYISNWLASNPWIRDVFLLLLLDPSTFGAGSQRSQPKHVSNPDPVIKKFNPPFC